MIYDRDCDFCVRWIRRWQMLTGSFMDYAASQDIAAQFPELDIDSCPLGVFGKVVADAETRSVQAGDRIEIYRPLLADPKEVRRLRAAKAAEARRLNS